jgi:tRNA-dihydrouridine synthase B
MMNIHDGFKIGPIEIKPATALAPMEGITDALFRRQIRACGGCGLTVTEFVNCEGLARDVSKVWEKALTGDTERPASIQIYGRQPDRIARAAAMCEERGAQIIDLNLGCPAKQVVSGNAGSALMKEPELCAEIFRTVRAAITIPMTVKMRLGWNYHKLNAPEIAHMAQEEGASMIAVHGRTREEAYRGKSHWEMVRPVVESVSIPVLVNGDILTRNDAREALEQSGAAGIMVGRGLLRNPWLLRQISEEYAGLPVFEPTLRERCDFVCQYMSAMETLPISRTGVMGKIKCFLGYFTRGLAYSSQMRERAYQYHTVEDIKHAVEDYFEALEREDMEEIFDAVVREPSADKRFKEGDPRRLD